MIGVSGGVYFLAFVVLVLMIIRWCMLSEQNPSSQSPDGLFTIRDSNKKTKTSRDPSKTSRRRNATRRHASEDDRTIPPA